MIIKCPFCNEPLSRNLQFTYERYEKFEEKWSDDCFDYECVTAVRKGTWTINQRYKPLSREDFGRKEFESDGIQMAIHIKDAINLFLDESAAGASGCCHADGSSGRNMRCTNCQNLIATVEMDCWQSKQILFDLAEDSNYLKLVPKNDYDYEFIFDPATHQDFPVYDFSKQFTHDDLSKISALYLTRRSKRIDDQVVSIINTSVKKGIKISFSGQDLFSLSKQGSTLIDKADLETVRRYLKELEDTFEVKEKVFWHSPASKTDEVYGVYFDGKEYPSDQILLDSFKNEANILNRNIDFEGFISEDGYEWIKKDLAPFLLPGAFCSDEPLEIEQVEKITKNLKRRIELLKTHEFETHIATGYWFSSLKFYQNYRPVIISLLEFTIDLLNKIVHQDGQVHINWI